MSAALVAGAALLVQPASGQAADTLPAYELEGVTVGVTRTTVDLTRVPQRISVVDAEVLSLTPASHAAEALRRSTAVDVIEYPGLLTGVAVRGFRPQYSGINPRVLILRDGRPAGTSNLALLGLADVERIEVLRGPASSLFGSSAMGGVINVVTRRSTGALAGGAELRYGSHGGYDTRVHVGGGIGAAADFNLALAATGQHAGYRTGSNRTFAADSLVKSLPDGATARLPWATADTTIRFTEYGARSASGRLGWALPGSWRLDASAEVYQADDVQNPGDLSTSWDDRSLKDIGRHSAALALSGATPRSTRSLRIFTARENVDYYRSPEPPTFVSYRTPVRTSGMQLLNAFRWGRHEATAGADYLRTDATSEAFAAHGEPAAPYTPNSSIHSLAAFARGHLNLLDDRLNVAGGVRLDRVSFHIRDTPNLGGYPPNSEDHLVFSPNLGARYEVVAGVQLYGNVGRGFVSPDAFNVAVYSEARAGSDGHVRVTRGNPHLRPETARTYEAGVTLAGGSPITLDAAFFHTDVRDRITTRNTTPDGIELTELGDTVVGVTTYVNADEAVMRGIEADLSIDLSRAVEGLRLFGTATRMLVAEDEFAGGTGREPILNVADLTLVAGVEYDVDGLAGVRLTGRYVGERYDSDYVDYQNPGKITYPAHLVFDGVASLRISDRYRLLLEGRNVLDEDYFEVRGYNLPGRSFRVGAGVTF